MLGLNVKIPVMLWYYLMFSVYSWIVWFRLDGIEGVTCGDDKNKTAGLLIKSFGRAHAIFDCPSLTEYSELHVLVQWYEGADLGITYPKDKNIYDSNSSLGLAHLTILPKPTTKVPKPTSPSENWSIMPVADIVSIRWIAKDFDNKNFRWVVNYDGFDFHYILGKNDEGRRE